MKALLFVLLCLLLLFSLASNVYLYSQLDANTPLAPTVNTPRTDSTQATISASLHNKLRAKAGSENLVQKPQGNVQQSRAQGLQQGRTWLQEEQFVRLSAFLQTYLKEQPQDMDFLLLEAELIAQTSLLSEAIVHYYSLLKLPMTMAQRQQIQDKISALSSTSIKQLEKAYSWEILAIFVEPLLQIAPDNRQYILALSKAYAEQQLINLMENTLAALPFDDPMASKIRDIIEFADTEQDPGSPQDNNQQQDSPLVGAINLKKFGDQFVVAAQLGGNNLELLIDTGASITAIDKDYYQQLSNRFKVKYMGRFQVNTANGSVMAPMYQFRDLQIGSRRIDNIAVMVLPMGGLEKANGLLGMNFLREFDFRIDQREAVLYLK